MGPPKQKPVGARIRVYPDRTPPHAGGRGPVVPGQRLVRLAGPPAVRPCPAPTSTRREPMRILVLGGDGYLGWPTAMYLSARGHDVGVLDNAVRRQYDHELGSGSLVPIEPMRTRVRAWQELTGRRIENFPGDLLEIGRAH